MIISHVVAMGDQRVIGRDGGLPWHIPADLKRFKAVTMGKMVLMGRKTYQSIGRPLPGRLNLVVTRKGSVADYPSDVVVCHSIEEALTYGRRVASEWHHELMVIGGGDIYRQTIDLVDRIYLSEVHATLAGDTYYPAIPVSFALQDKEDCIGPPDFSWCLFVKKAGVKK